MLTTIHVTLDINGIARKRPLRIYDASHGVFGVIIKGECHAVVATGPKTVKLHTRLAPKPEASCRAAKLVDLGIDKQAKPVTPTTQAKAINAKLTPELATQMIAMLQTYLAQ